MTHIGTVRLLASFAPLLLCTLPACLEVGDADLGAGGAALTLPPGYDPRNPSSIYAACGVTPPPGTTTTINTDPLAPAAVCGAVQTDPRTNQSTLIINTNSCGAEDACCTVQHESLHAPQQQHIRDFCLADAACYQQYADACVTLMEAEAYNSECARGTACRAGCCMVPSICANVTPAMLRLCGRFLANPSANPCSSPRLKRIGACPSPTPSPTPTPTPSPSPSSSSWNE